MTNPPSLVGPKRDRAARGDLDVHDHVCGIYDTREEQYEPACRFLQAGLERRQQCLYIVEQKTPPEFLFLLEKHGVRVKESMRTGALQVLSGEDVRRQLGGFTPEAMFSFLSQSEQKARESGFAAFRWAAEMTWLRKDNIKPVDLFTFEAELNPFLAQHELVALCQYAMEDFKAELLIAAAETHSLLVYNDTVCNNFYYIPPEEFLRPQFADLKLRRMLFNIMSRERLMYKYLNE